MVRTTRRTAVRASDQTASRQERFARAVDGGMRELSDHALERELAVVAALRQAGAAAGPRPDEVDRIRRRVMAGFPATTVAGAKIADAGLPAPTGSMRSRGREWYCRRPAAGADGTAAATARRWASRPALRW